MTTPRSQPRPLIAPMPGGVTIRLKVVPGAKKNEIVGTIAMPDGERLKVKVSAPPEDGRANEAVCALLAKALGLSRSAVEITAGHASREKTAKVRGVTVEQAAGLSR